VNNKLLVYGLLADAIRDGGNPTFGEIAKRLDIDFKTVSRSVRELRQSGYLTAVRKRSDRRRYEYRLTDKTPPWYERVIAWSYRFRPTESNRRFWEAAISSRVFYKAREVRGKRCNDPEFIELRDALFAEHPDLCDAMAVWPVDEALDIEQRLNALLDWGKHDQVRAVATVPAAEPRDRP